MKPLLVVGALLLSTPAAAQYTNSSGILQGPYIPALHTGQYDFPGRYDDKTTRIDRRNSARYQAAKMARKARERAEREARQVDRAERGLRISA